MRRALAVVALTTALTGSGIAFAGGTTILDKHGSGQDRTRPFHVAGSWHLKWSYDCSNFGQTGNFQIYVQTSTGADAYPDDGPNKLGRSGHGKTYEPVGGHYYLDINSECKWHVKVKGHR